MDLISYTVFDLKQKYELKDNNNTLPKLFKRRNKKEWIVLVTV